VSRTVSAEEAVEVVRSGHRVFVHSVAAAPRRLVAALTARAGELRVVEMVHLHTEGDAPYAAPGLEKSFRVNALFVGANVRAAVQEGRGDYLPVFLSEVPQLFRRGLLPLDVALVSVSPPDRHGFCSLGVSVDVARAAVQTARTVVAQVNRHMPRTHGDGLPAWRPTSSERSVATAPISSRTAPRSRSGSAACPPRRSRPSAATSASGSTRR
jgi:4-hydroxybutyrate CoA-transferase